VLALSGGTCLHKVHAPQPSRYSEDLDFVVPRSPLRWECARHLRNMLLDLNLLDFRGVRHKKGPFPGLYMNYLDVVGRPRVLKMEIATGPLADHGVRKPYSVDSIWFQGKVNLLCLSLDAILATKVAALFGRKKPRDLMDLWYGIVHLGGDLDEIARYFSLIEVSRRWNTFTAVENMVEKLNDYIYLETLRDVRMAGWKFGTLPEAVAVFDNVVSYIGKTLHRETSNRKYKRLTHAQRQQQLSEVSRGLASNAAAAVPKAGLPHPAAGSPRLSAAVLVCGKWMPRAKTQCVLPAAHTGSCRSKRS